MLIYRKKGRKPILGIDFKMRLKMMSYLEELPNISMTFPGYDLPEVSFYDYKGFFQRITPEIIKERLWGK